MVHLCVWFKQTAVRPELLATALQAASPGTAAEMGVNLIQAKLVVPAYALVLQTRCDMCGI